MIGLIDANSFYVSCEQVFQPRLRGLPCVVLSNNDANVIARSPEAKAIPIGMGAPLFKIQHLIHRHHVQVRSSNYELYGDLSRRVMNVLREFSPAVEVYSIDEAFVDLGDREPLTLANTLKQKVRQWVGIPVSVGVAPTKVLSKVAHHLAKQSPQSDGIYGLFDDDAIVAALTHLAVEDIWGVSKGLGKRLRLLGLTTALQFRDAPDALVRQKLGVVGARIQYELRGLNCLPLETSPPPRKNTVCSRSFGQALTELEPLQEAIAVFTSRACQRLRRWELAAQRMGVFIATSSRQPDYVSRSLSWELPLASNCTPELISYARAGLSGLFEQGHHYRRAGVSLERLVPQNVVQQNLFFPDEDWPQRQQWMQTIDRLRSEHPDAYIQFAACGGEGAWQTRCQWRSPRFTTRWEELALAL